MKKILVFLLLLSGCWAPTEEIPVCDHAGAIKFLRESVIQFGDTSIANDILVHDITEIETDRETKTRFCNAVLEYDWPGADMRLVLLVEYSLHFLNPSNQTNLFAQVLDVEIVE